MGVSKLTRVAFSGAQSTGKTTLLNALRESADFKDCKFYDEITRQIKEQGFKINEQGTDATQLKIMQEHKRRVNAKDSGLVIFDRCSLDGLVYTQFLYNKGQVSKDTLDEATKVFEETIMQWDAIFFLRPEFEIVDDGVRSVNVEFHRNIVFLFDYFIEKYNLQVIQLTGSVEDRVKQFVEYSKLFDVKVDLHIHLGECPKSFTKLNGSTAICPTVDEVLEHLEKYQITHAVILYENYEMLEQLSKRYHGELYGLQYIYDENQELDIGKPLFKGVKLHNRRNHSKYRYDKVEHIIKQLPNNSIILYHTQQRCETLQLGEDQIQQILYYAVKYPHIKHIVGHAGAYAVGSYKPTNRDSESFGMLLRYFYQNVYTHQAAQTIADLPNVLLESSCFNKTKAKIIRKFGIGSDFSFGKGNHNYDQQLRSYVRVSGIPSILIQKQALDFLELNLECCYN